MCAQVAQAGSTVRLNCSASDAGAALSWARDGAALAGAAGAALVLRAVSRAHAGLYQCRARRGARVEQAAAEVRLGGQSALSPQDFTCLYGKTLFRRTSG